MRWGARREFGPREGSEGTFKVGDVALNADRVVVRSGIIVAEGGSAPIGVGPLAQTTSYSRWVFSLSLP